MFLQQFQCSDWFQINTKFFLINTIYYNNHDSNFQLILTQLLKEFFETCNLEFMSGKKAQKCAKRHFTTREIDRFRKLE